MPKVNIDGIEVEFLPGEKIIQVAKKVQNHIPHYCYHDGLAIVAQCRMCLVEVEGQKKLVTACSTPCADGMKVRTNSERVKTSVAGVQEFLLANHPLDCPICDQAGECSLQDYSFKHGEADTKYDFFRRTFIDVDMGPSIKKNMNRCIHCTRCIRYCDEVGKVHEMVALQRGNSTEIVTLDGKPLQTAYAGGLADVCPVGSLTTKDFRFKKRVIQRN
jgi:NADH-quinone oxidoreductase subunit G